VFAVLVSFWFFVVALRYTVWSPIPAVCLITPCNTKSDGVSRTQTDHPSQGHFPPAISQWNTDRAAPAPSGPPEANTLETQRKALAEQEQILKDREAELESREKALKTQQSALLETTAKLEGQRPKSLVSYVYTEGDTNRRNLEFFIQHGLYASADFVFSFNGDTDAEKLLPIYEGSPYYDPKVKNIEVLKRDNKCFDMGAHGEALLREWNEAGTKLSPMGGHDRGGRKFWEGYQRFMLMNASVRGPFMPHWSGTCWSDAFWDLITDKKKVCLTPAFLP